jgi:hypothetical protein
VHHPPREGVSRFHKILLFLLLTFSLATAMSLSGCSKDDPVAPRSVDPVDPATVNKFVQDLPAWEVPDDTKA